MKKSFLYILFSALIFVVLATFVARHYRVTGDCMEPAVKDKQLCFLNKLLPYIRGYKLGDIVLFNHENKVWISRIVALENNTIHIKEGSVLINDVEDAIKRSWHRWKHGSYALNKSFTVPKEHVFVLSDNLAACHDDSRVFGPIHMSSILGIVW